MTWEYVLIGLVLGIIISAITMYYSNCKPRQQQELQYKLNKNTAELNEYRKELAKYSARNAELLDNMANDYRQLYHYIVNSSNGLSTNYHNESNLFRHQITETDKDQITTKIQPRDYPEGDKSLGLLSKTRGLHK